MQLMISYLIICLGWYVMLKFIFNIIVYCLDCFVGDMQDMQINCMLFMFLFDLGMIFECDVLLVIKLFGVNYIQMLELCVFYVYMLYCDQLQILLFDIGQLDYNFGQIFMENLYIGYDCIVDNNKLMVGVIMCFIEVELGIECLWVMIV